MSSWMKDYEQEWDKKMQQPQKNKGSGIGLALPWWRREREHHQNGYEVESLGEE